MEPIIPIAIVAIAILICILAGGIHKVEEGHVAVYFRGGKLLDDVNAPGFHVLIPFLTTYENVQTTVQTDEVRRIPCGTSGGVMIYFEKIEVVNRLKVVHVRETVLNYTTAYDKTWIYDKIHHEINQFCSNHTLQEVYIDLFDSIDEALVSALKEDCELWAPGIEILSIRVTKPLIPDSIISNYERMDIEKTNLLVAIQEQKVAAQRAETKRQESIINAKRDADVSKINMEKMLNEKESEKKRAIIENEIFFSNEETKTNAAYYKNMKEIEANTKKLTKEYLKYEAIKALSSNTKFYFGESIPKFFTTNLDILPSNLH